MTIRRLLLLGIAAVAPVFAAGTASAAHDRYTPTRYDRYDRYDRNDRDDYRYRRPPARYEPPHCEPPRHVQRMVFNVYFEDCHRGQWVHYGSYPTRYDAHLAARYLQDRQGRRTWVREEGV